MVKEASGSEHLGSLAFSLRVSSVVRYLGINCDKNLAGERLRKTLAYSAERSEVSRTLSMQRRDLPFMPPGFPKEPARCESNLTLANLETTDPIARRSLSSQRESNLQPPDLRCTDCLESLGERVRSSHIGFDELKTISRSPASCIKPQYGAQY